MNIEITVNTVAYVRPGEVDMEKSTFSAILTDENDPQSFIDVPVKYDGVERPDDEPGVEYLVFRDDAADELYSVKKDSIIDMIMSGEDESVTASPGGVNEQDGEETVAIDESVLDGAPDDGFEARMGKSVDVDPDAHGDDDANNVNDIDPNRVRRFVKRPVLQAVAPVTAPAAVAIPQLTQPVAAPKEAEVKEVNLDDEPDNTDSQIKARLRQVEKELAEIRELTPDVALANAQIIEVLAGAVTQRSIRVTRFLQKSTSVMLKTLMGDGATRHMCGSRSIDPELYMQWDETTLAEIMAHIIRDYAAAKIKASDFDNRQAEWDSRKQSLLGDIAKSKAMVETLTARLESIGDAPETVDIRVLSGENATLKAQVANLTTKLAAFADINEVYVLYCDEAKAFIHADRKSQAVTFTNSMIGTATDITLYRKEVLDSALRVISEWLLVAGKDLAVDVAGVKTLTIRPIKIVGKAMSAMRVSASEQGVRIREVTDQTPYKPALPDLRDMDNLDPVVEEKQEAAAPDIVDDLDAPFENAPRGPKPANLVGRPTPVDADDLDAPESETEMESGSEVVNDQDAETGALDDSVVDDLDAPEAEVKVNNVKPTGGFVRKPIMPTMHAPATSPLAMARKHGLASVMPRKGGGASAILERRLIKK